MKSIEDIARETGVQGLVRLPRDMSPREYYRGLRGEEPVIVMVYAEISPKNSAELRSFLNIADVLRGVNLKAPQALTKDEEQVWAVLEDFGQISFGRALRENIVPCAELYELGCDVLKKLAEIKVPAGFPDYKTSRIHENRRQILDYYAPLKTKKPINNSILKNYINVLQQIEDGLPPCPQGFLHADFHLENLMWLPEGAGLNHCGIIDFQDALLGPLPYDLVNLLEDARVDVPVDLKHAMLERYCEAMSPREKETFLIWFRFLAVQFHCRVIGLFLKVALEQGRDQYLIHVPRLQNYITQGLMHPIMTPLRQFFEKEKIDFLPFEAMNGDELRAIYRSIPQDNKE